MKIIQSFAQFEEGSHYLRYDKLNTEKIYLNFYVMLLSVLTLQKYYGEVTMYCNQKAYDSFLKFLPYKKIEIVENENDFVFWNYYKIDTIRNQTSEFIHVDPDVIIFDDLFSEFKTNKYDIIVQDTIIESHNPVKIETEKIKKFLSDTGYMEPSLFDGRAFSNGVVGMSTSVRDEYVVLSDMMKNAFFVGEFDVHPDFISMISEETALYILAKRNNLKPYEVLPYNMVLNNGSRTAANQKKYTHMWGDSKLNPQYIKIMKLKTIKEFPEYQDTILKYEKDVLKKRNKLAITW